jgi:hypothetical protein
MRAPIVVLVVAFAIGPAKAQERKAPSAPPRATAVVFDFSKPVPDTFWEVLQEELDQTATPTSADRSLKWMKRAEFQRGMEFPEIVQVRLQGHCKADLTGDWQYADPGPLGWVYLAGGEIQPVAYVNCDRIGKTLERDLRGMNFKERQAKFARAISRVVAHELTHIFTQSLKHSSTGLQSASLTAKELTRAGGF